MILYVKNVIGYCRLRVCLSILPSYPIEMVQWDSLRNFNLYDNEGTDSNHRTPAKQIPQTHVFCSRTRATSHCLSH